MSHTHVGTCWKPLLPAQLQSLNTVNKYAHLCAGAQSRSLIWPRGPAWAARRGLPWWGSAARHSVSEDGLPLHDARLACLLTHTLLSRAATRPGAEGQPGHPGRPRAGGAALQGVLAQRRGVVRRCGAALRANDCAPQPALYG